MWHALQSVNTVARIRRGSEVGVMVWKSMPGMGRPLTDYVRAITKSSDESPERVFCLLVDISVNEGFCGGVGVVRQVLHGQGSMA
jgi:hypothetical protein